LQTSELGIDCRMSTSPKKAELPPARLRLPNRADLLLNPTKALANGTSKRLWACASAADDSEFIEFAPGSPDLTSDWSPHSSLHFCPRCATAQCKSSYHIVQYCYLHFGVGSSVPDFCFELCQLRYAPSVEVAQSSSLVDRAGWLRQRLPTDNLVARATTAPSSRTFKDMAQNGQAAMPATSSAPTQPAAKSATAAPKLANELELSNMPGGTEESDVMQLARIGDIAGMQKIFDAGDIDASFSDGEGITPLHVRRLCSFSPCLARPVAAWLTW
jgi:hypothetical protein